MKSLLKLSITLLIILLLSYGNEAQQPTYLYHICNNDVGNYTTNSTFASNLNQLLFSLNSTNNTNSFTNGFNNATAGSAYGLFLCRGDLSSTTCQNCVTFATSDITNRCPVQKGAYIWYDQCFLRYSNQSFFSHMSASPDVYMWNTQNVSQADDFNSILGSTMSDAAKEAAESKQRFATKKANFTVFQTLYTLVQCTIDISSFDCNLCLSQCISQLPTCCNQKQGGRVLAPSCNIRYELYPFYNETSTLAPPPPPPITTRSPPPVSEPAPPGSSGLSTVTIIAIVAPISVSVLLFIAGCCYLNRRGRKKYGVAAQDETNELDISSVDSLQFDFATIQRATSEFSDDNKLGEGGFGQVYKGVLPSGQEVAVKRLSRSSGQGAEEFKNEIALVAKLQHRNLVRLLGFCLEGEEKLLVYEFVPNKSLDYFLFDPEKQGLLDWSRRYKVIGGIARGIQYLHEDSRLRIIHRDLKASNILLDGDMNPKVSDFGMARIFDADETQGSTHRIVGTYGYMSPEYAMHGQFSVKTDVFSFGVLVLEILTGQKNSNFYQTDGASDLLSYAWQHWRNGTTLELLDPAIGESYSTNEVSRCVHIALLSVQEDPLDRPTFATILLMLNSYSVTLPVPNAPAFFNHCRTDGNSQLKGSESDKSTIKSMQLSVDESSITGVYPR